MVEDSKESENDNDLDSQIVQIICNLEQEDEEQKSIWNMWIIKLVFKMMQKVLNFTCRFKNC